MDIFFTIFKAFATGLFAACLVGPVLGLVLYRTVSSGTKSGLFSALGMAIADGTFFFISLLSFNSGKAFLLELINSFKIVGGPIMISSGIWTLARKLNSSNSQEMFLDIFSFLGTGWYTLSVLFLTLANPLTLIFFGSLVSQFFSEAPNFTIPEMALYALFLAAGSFCTLGLMIFAVHKQKNTNFNIDAFIEGLRIVSGYSLIILGLFLTWKYLIAAEPVWNWMTEKILKMR